MAKPKRDIGQEILTGIRELNLVESGRIRHLPSTAATRERTHPIRLQAALREGGHRGAAVNFPRHRAVLWSTLH
ncbi:MAG: hypothetical protein NDI88_08765 [Lysobacter sp.]|nr:hypothetical protein [Lysobacter sp.]